MSDFIIPVPETTDSSIQQVELDGLIYDLQFYWNSRDNHWFLSIGRNGVFLLEGIKLINTADLIGEFGRIKDLPPGILSIVDIDGFDRDPCSLCFFDQGVSRFGDRVQLRYTEAENVL